MDLYTNRKSSKRDLQQAQHTSTLTYAKDSKIVEIGNGFGSRGAISNVSHMDKGEVGLMEDKQQEHPTTINVAVMECPDMGNLDLRMMQGGVTVINQPDRRDLVVQDGKDAAFSLVSNKSGRLMGKGIFMVKPGVKPKIYVQDDTCVSSGVQMKDLHTWNGAISNGERSHADKGKVGLMEDEQQEHATTFNVVVVECPNMGSLDLRMIYNRGKREVKGMEKASFNPSSESINMVATKDTSVTDSVSVSCIKVKQPDRRDLVVQGGKM
ncbi:unnamed protein product [Dovyalis caffra]|uniref:Uncharacterized protein n=1 Tax=Dovyalis caffra TaxID=77055 RepID=A0AAV1RJH8_9ROSI|nr:unnamed protein product [Dovyalis caffra]